MSVFERHIGIIALLAVLFFPTRAVAYRADSTMSDQRVKTERVALKNNLLYDAAATPNLALEVVLAPHWTLEFGAGFNPFPLDDTKFPKWRHVAAWVAPRYWFCHTFHRDFVSVNVAYAHYNVGGDAYPLSWMYPQIKTMRYQGDAVMGGASYGWHFAIKPHFSIELEAGVDAGYAWFDAFECKHCGDKKASGGRWFVLPKVGVNLVVPFGGDELSLAKRCDCEKLEMPEPEEAPVDTVVPEPIDTVVPEPIDTVVPEPIDTIVPEPIDTVVPEPIDTVVPEPIDTVVPMPVDTVEPEEPRAPWIPASRIKAPIVKKMPFRKAFVPHFELMLDNMYRLRNRLLRSEDAYEPYVDTIALSADPRNVFMFFDVNVAKMDRSFLNNSMLMDSIIQILGTAVEDTTIRITHIQIVGFASFDGRQAYNYELAGNRAATLKEYIQSIYPLPDSVFTVHNGGESWAELRYRLEKVEFEGKEDVLRIIDTEPNLDRREALIKQLNKGATYRYMRDELKTILRNLGCITIYFEDITFEKMIEDTN